MLQFDIQYCRGNFNLEVSAKLEAGQFTAIYGASGAGKSSLLNAIAGFEQAERGSRVVLDNDIWLAPTGEALPIHARGVGYVTQDPSLFEHLDTEGNLDFAEQRQFNAPPYTREALVDALELQPLLKKFPWQLSGGERQRVAIARALISGPSLLLLDEPINALDHDAREDVLSFLERLRNRSQAPVVFVTHQQEELMRLADRILLLQDGRFTGDYTTGELLASLDSPLSGHHERGVIIESAISEVDERYALAAVTLGDANDVAPPQLWLACQRATPGDRVRVRIYARDISLTLSPPNDSSIINCVPAHVSEIAAPGEAHSLVKLRCGNQDLIAKLTQKSIAELRVTPGQQLYAQVKGVALLGIDDSEQYNHSIRPGNPE